jgi:GMP synthase (glutamine-hydrolysing)
VPETFPLLLLVLGEAPQAVSQAHGPFASWFERVAEEPLTVLDGRLGGAGAARTPDVRDFAGVLITGSAASLATPQPEPWMDAATELVVKAHDAGVPVLGVCFGHQLVARIFGARVVVNPRGYEVGTTRVELTPAGRADPLFDGLPDTLTANQSHFDTVDAPPPGVSVLAWSDKTPVQAVGVSSHVRGVQFHPEIDGAIMRSYLSARRSSIVDRDPDDLLAAAADCPEAARVIGNFRRHFVARA